MHILLTRPLEDCSEMIVKFQSLDHKVSHLPLINVENVQHEKINPDDYGGIIFTSSNGSATEKKARSLGFQNTIAAEGNVSNLKELILQNYELKETPLLYVSGEIISTDLDQQLLREGYTVKRIINYKVNHIEKFDENFVNELKQNMPDIVYVYSQNSASSFLNFIKIYQTENLWMNTNLMCIGEKTSSILNEIKWKKIFLFNPGEEEFLLYKI